MWDKDFKSAIINIFIKLKETVSKELKYKDNISPTEYITKDKYCEKEPKRTTDVEKYNNKFIFHWRCSTADLS